LFVADRDADDVLMLNTYALLLAHSGLYRSAADALARYLNSAHSLFVIQLQEEKVNDWYNFIGGIAFAAQAI